MEKILITGSLGQIGSELLPKLQEQHGIDNVIALYNRKEPDNQPGIFVQANVLDQPKIEQIVKDHQITTIYHLASLLSATGEAKPHLAWDVNVNGLKIILDLAVKYNCKVFWPSSIAAFGPTTPRHNTPQQTTLEPTTMYGVTKVTGELMCQYYWHKFNVDVRSLRYPGIISYKTPPGGGTTDYAVAAFYDGITDGQYEYFVKPDTCLPMMYMDDAVNATLQLMETDAQNITIRTSYNLAAISFTAEELTQAIKAQIPFEATYVPDFRQSIADSWPTSIDDSIARRDWGWDHTFDLPKMTETMIQNLRKKLT